MFGLKKERKARIYSRHFSCIYVVINAGIYSFIDSWW